jgi:hypothetical protein
MAEAGRAREGMRGKKRSTSSFSREPAPVKIAFMIHERNHGLTISGRSTTYDCYDGI